MDGKGGRRKVVVERGGEERAEVYCCYGGNPGP
jgi:hypothetical protein